MAAGRHGVFRDDEFSYRQALGISKKENGYTKEEYERIRTGIQDEETGQGQGRGSLEYRVWIRQKYIKDREVMNGGHDSCSSLSDSGSRGAGGPGRRRFVVLSMDRLSGELLSTGSDEAIDSEARANRGSEIKKIQTMDQLSHLQTRKRKFSPSVWDRDDREVTRSIKSRSSAKTANLPASPPLVKSHGQLGNPKSAPDGNLQISPTHDSEVSLETSPHKADLRQDLSEFPAETSMHPGEHWVKNNGTGVVDCNDYVPMRSITSSRWADDADSPADEGEITNHKDMLKLKSKPGFDLGEVRGRSKSASPEDGEVKRDGSEGSRGRSSGLDECVESFDGESYLDNCDNSDCMVTDDNCNYDGYSCSHSEIESEDGSHCSPEPSYPQQRSVNMLHGCRSVDEFEKLNKINEGTYGVVYRARDKKTGEIVALKKVKMEKEREGFPLTSLREMNILLSFDHPSVVDVKEVVMGNLDSIFMVMQYMEHDLKALMETMEQPFCQSEAKCLMLQLLLGVKYLHDNWVLHRDLKTSNLLLNNQGELKICDFGLARQYGSPLKPYTDFVVTLWYRAPELLLGVKEYSTAIDMWSIGCIMAELLSKEPLFKGKTEFDQLDKIFRILGTPNEKIWPGFSKLPGVKLNFVKHQYNILQTKFPATSFTGSPVLSDTGFDLLSRLLTYDPEKRISAEAALNHEWFREVLLPKSKEFTPTFPAQHTQDRPV